MLKINARPDPTVVGDNAQVDVTMLGDYSAAGYDHRFKLPPEQRKRLGRGSTLSRGARVQVGTRLQVQCESFASEVIRHHGNAHRLKRLALDVWDIYRQHGSRPLSAAAWAQRFYRRNREAYKDESGAALRAWERWKRDLRELAAGLFDLEWEWTHASETETGNGLGIVITRSAYEWANAYLDAPWNSIPEDSEEAKRLAGPTLDEEEALRALERMERGA